VFGVMTLEQLQSNSILLRRFFMVLLSVFAALVLTAHAANISNPATVFACALYFWARIAHWLAYTAAVPWARTLAFTGGFIAQMILAWQLVIH